MSRPIDRLLQRLPRAKKAGEGWRAPCPSCGPDSKSAKLAVSEGADGRVLLHCFAGCAASAVLAAVGLSAADLFDRPIPTASASPDERRRRGVEMDLAAVRAAAETLDLEAVVLQVACERVIEGVPLDEGDRKRLALAHQRITDALQHLRAARVRRPRAAA